MHRSFDNIQVNSIIDVVSQDNLWLIKQSNITEEDKLKLSIDMWIYGNDTKGFILNLSTNEVL